MATDIEPKAVEHPVLQATAAALGLTLQAHHLAGVAENFARLAHQAALLEGSPPEASDEPAPTYTP